MAHIFFIDPIEKLNTKKDSTFMMALSFQKEGIESYVLFEKDFYVDNEPNSTLRVHKFNGEFESDGCYLNSFILKEEIEYTIEAKDYIHMRIDPPYDTRYQRYLWMLDLLRDKSGIAVLNDPIGIMKNNEKLLAYKDRASSHESYIGSSEKDFISFTRMLKERGYDSVILKPLDLYSGIGVEKVELNDNEFIQKFRKKVDEFQGAIVCQPFIKDVYDGEYRAIYFDGVEIGSIIKRPNPGEFLANIAQGAKFEKVALPVTLRSVCDKIAKNLLTDGVRLVAFDLLGGKVNEVNVTCPGLLVEVSYAYQKNLSSLIARKFC